ncbi:hypothetical protein BUALT_Bualt13G0024900 [Buddleja alternifolia]|uniref:Uncharacterized protein n=1 Tax=Buddleja alternifolia TaxID=168488 RepID=A0AAV6WRB8_9LAMI|nr:hypothetical protein BUALT_Bualt13G0024900 [Buddleja alternifolia]
MKKANQSLCKDSWPELVGVNGKEAAIVVKKENENVKDTPVLMDGTPVTGDFRFDRVRIFVNCNGEVVRAPI